MVDFPDAFRREAAALEADGVDAVSMGIAGSGGFRKWKNVARDGGAAADVGMGADADELVDGAECADDGPLFDRYMAT